MLFNSYPFIFLFLPIVLGGFFALARLGHGVAAAWLAAASLFFYGWWNPVYLWLLLASIGWNFVMGRAITRFAASGARRACSIALVAALAGNLAVLGYYKYSGFMVENLAALFGTGWRIENIILPLGISFYTFTQIAFLVDAWRGEAKEYSFVHYLLFISYFPHLLAGPILHHRDVMPQFENPATYRPDPGLVTSGLMIFVMGLFKKVVLADGVAQYVGPGFEAARLGQASAFDAWGAGLGFTLQIYFDFSAYSDMAVGVSRMFGIRIPINFNSPFQSRNITELWQRWHMSLTRFLGDYLFRPLGGLKRSAPRRAFALLTTMLLAGLWHGAGWTFILFGGLHGVYLLIHHNWRIRQRKAGKKKNQESRLGHWSSWALTFLAWVVGAVMFRADSMGTWWNMMKAMAGVNGVRLPDAWQTQLGAVGVALEHVGIGFGQVAAPSAIKGLAWAIPLLVVAALWPNTQRILSVHLAKDYRASDIAEPPLFRRVLWAPTAVWAVVLGLCAAFSLLNMTRISEFLYYQF